MDVTDFCCEARAPKSLVPNLILLNLGDDFARFCEQPTDWLSHTKAERSLYALPLLHNAWRYWEKRIVDIRRKDRDAVLESVFSLLVRVCGKLHAGIDNPARYIFSSIRNGMKREIDRQQPAFLLSEDLDNGLFGDECAADIAEHLSRRYSMHEIHDLLDSCCQNDVERDICYARCIRVFRGWIATEYVTDIATQLDLPQEHVIHVLEGLQTRFLNRVNAKKRQQHKKLIERVPLSRISPDDLVPTLPSKSTIAA